MLCRSFKYHVWLRKYRLTKLSPSFLITLYFIVYGDITSPQTLPLLVKRYRAVRMAEEVQILRESATILRHTYIAHFVFTIEKHCIFKCVTNTHILAIKMSCHPKVTTFSASVTLNGLALHFTDYISRWVYLAILFRQVSSTSNRTIVVISVDIRRTLKCKPCSNLPMEICESHNFKENRGFLYEECMRNSLNDTSKAGLGFACGGAVRIE